jgi:SAM-dependent methyltransferase
MHNKPVTLDRGFGREAFGADPAAYHAARPAYPGATWQALSERAGLRQGIDILEIGAGTGLATTELLSHHPRRLVAIEPDHRLADYLGARLADTRLEVLPATFEAAMLPPASFDLVAAATVFHWLDAVPALRRIHGLLRPGGAVALWWNSFGDPTRPDPFHEATLHLFEGQRPSPSAGEAGRPPHALDEEARLAEFREAGFVPDPPQLIPWQLTLDPAGVRALYATWSNVTALPQAERSALLDGLAEIAASRFAGRVHRNMTTAIYTGRRRGAASGRD